MAVSFKNDEEFFLKAIERSIREAMASLIVEEAAKAGERVRELMSAQADQLALGLLKHYDVQSGHDGIVITVRKLNND